MTVAPKYKILLTGGAGFIGSHLADAFVAQGHDVHIIDDLSSGKLENIPQGATFHQLNIASEEVEALFAQERFEVLVHQAAQMDVRRSVADPRFDARINIDGFLNLMECGRKNGLKKVLFASTGGAIYGDPVYTPQDEEHQQAPVSPYGISKLATEKYLHFYEKEYGIPYIALRYANVYGPRQNPHGEAGVVAIFATKMLNGEQPMINGDGQQTRDYVFVGDVVQMNLHALHYEKSGVFNVGTGKETNVIELFRGIRAEIGQHFPEIYRAAAAGEQRRSVVGIRKANETFGWKPQYDLAAGLSETIAWFKALRLN
jgi:UDP-glucose 4-epimerase